MGSFSHMYLARITPDCNSLFSREANVMYAFSLHNVCRVMQTLSSFPVINESVIDKNNMHSSILLYNDCTQTSLNTTPHQCAIGVYKANKKNSDSMIILWNCIFSRLIQI